MQLTLLTTFAQPSPAAGPVSRRAPGVPSRESVAMSQLDRIAAQNLRGPAQGLGASGMLLALLGGLVVLGSASMWNSAAGNEPRMVVLAADSPPAVAAVTPVPATVSTPTIAAPAAAGSDVAPGATPPALTTAPPVTADMVAAAQPSADDAARKARARQLAEARRKAAQLAQERAAAEESQRLQLAQQREAERVQQQQLAEQTRLQTVQLALHTRRSVGDACSASGGPISRHFCSARECSKPEHQGDPVCVTLREDDLARQRASNER
jgi:hypothetical protein